MRFKSYRNYMGDTNGTEGKKRFFEEKYDVLFES